MRDSHEPLTSDPLDAIIADYVQQVERGQVPDREAMLLRHLDLADRLRAFFADYDRLDRQGAELRLSADPDRTVGQASDLPESPDPNLPRVRYFGDYELLEVIARGGMGVVYKARQVSLNRLVALKMILKGELAAPRDVARFRAEAEAAANLDHPHIVPIYEVGEHDGQQYYAMRFIEGTALTRRPRADARKEAGLVATVARAVYHAHQHGVLHRDLKPSNILVDPAGVPYVADFGLAKRVDADHSLTEPGAVVGTPRYMAPEQAAARKDLTVAADVYSLGVVLYERLTGQTPFGGETPLEVLRQVREAEPPRPSAIIPGLNRDLETICLKCLEKDPANRYGSAAALAEDLERWRRGEPITARPVGKVERAWRWCRRNPAVASLTAAVALALAAGTAVATFFAVEAHSRSLEAEDHATQATREASRATDEWQRAEGQRKKAEDNEYTALQNLYVAQINQAWQSWQLAQIDRMEFLLKQQIPKGAGQPDFRGFEWHYLNRLSHGYERELTGREVKFPGPLPGSLLGVASIAQQMVFSPDGKFLATANRGVHGGTWEIELWDPAESKRVFRHAVPEDARFNKSMIAFSRDSRYLAAASPRFEPAAPDEEPRVQVWEVPSGKPVTSVPGHLCVGFSPDGKMLAAIQNKAEKPATVPAVRKPPGGDLDASEYVVLREWPSGKEVSWIKAPYPWIDTFTFAPSGDVLAVGCSIYPVGQKNPQLCLLNLHTGKQLWVRNLEFPARVVSFSPDGKRLALDCGTKNVTVYDAATGKSHFTLNHTCWVQDVVFSPDQKALATACSDNTIRLWHPQTGEELRVVRGHSRSVASIAFHPTGRQLASASYDATVKLWDLDKDAEGKSVQLPVSKGAQPRLTFHPNGKHLVAMGTEIAVWDLESGKQVPKLDWLQPGKKPAEPGFSFFNLQAFSHNGSRVAHETRSAWALHVWSTATKKPLCTVELGQNWALSPDGLLLATTTTGIPENALRLWDVDSGKKLQEWPGGAKTSFTCLAFSRDSRWLAGGTSGTTPMGTEDDTCFVRDISTGKLIHEFSLGQRQYPLAVLISPDKRRLLGAGDSKVAVWDLKTGTLQNAFDISHVTFAAFTSDATRLATVGGVGTDQRIHLWHVPTGLELLSLPSPTVGVLSFAISPDNRRIALVGSREDQTSMLRVLDGTPMQENP
jgi:WD40 repeat protein